MAQPQVGEIIDGYRFNGGDPGSQESWSQGPSAGDVVDGYKFKGGDPSDEASWSVAKAESKGMLSSVAEAVGWKKGNDFKVPEGQVVTENTFTAGMPEEEAKPKRNIAMENSLMRGMDGTPATEQTEAVSDLPSVKKVSKPVSNFERQKESNRKWLDNSKALVVDQLISDNNLSPDDASFEFSRMRSYGVVPNATETGLRESTWGEAFDSGIAKVKPSFDKSMAGLASAKADATGDFDLANVADALRKTANAQLAEAEGILAGTSKDSWKKTISDAPASIAQNLPTIIAASAVASNPLLAGVIGNIGLAGMGMVSAGTAYSEGKDTGLNVSNNMQQSVLTGLAEVIPEKMSLNVLIGALGKNAAKQAMSDSIVQSAKTLGKYIGTEIGTEEITTIANFGIDKMYSKPDMPIKELVSQMIDTAKATLIQAPILGGAGIVTKAAVDGAGRVIDPVGYQLQGYDNAVERTNFAPMQSDGNTQAADAAKQSAMNAWSNGLAGAPKPTVKDITAAPDLDSAIRAAESVIADVAPVTIPDAPVQPPAPVAQIDPEIAALNQEATKIDQGKLLADIEAHINPTGTLTVTGKGAADAVRSLGEEIPFVQHKDGSVLVSARFAEPVSLAIQQAQQLTKPLEQTFTPMPIPATVASTLDANPIRPQTIAGQSAETYTDEQLAEITQSVTTNIDTRKGAAIELQARSVEQSTEPVVEQQPQPKQPTPVIESPVVSQPQRAKSKALKFTGNIINDLKVLGVDPRMLSRIVTDGTRSTESIDDLSELAYRLRNELGYMFDDVNNDASQGLVEYLRRVSNNEVSPLNASRMEQDIADREEYLNKQSVIERAKELGLKGIGGKRTLAVVEADIARVEQERDDMEAREERAAIQAESAASEAFVDDDAPMSEDDFRKYFAQSASVEYTQEDIDRAIEYQTNRENDRTEAATGYAAEGETQGDSGQRNQDGETQEGARGTAEEGLTLTGETNAKESPPKYGIYQLADGSFAKFDRVWYRGEKTERAAMLSEMVIPGNASPKDRMGSQSWMFVKGFSRNEFDGSPLRLTKNGEDVTANVESPLELTGETNEEASANASRKIDPNALTKEEINAQSAGFGLQQQEGAPKPGPVQEGLRFSRVSDAPKGEELVAIHNLSAENVLHAASIGGIPVPSIGITKSASPFTGFGEITLIASNDMIDPDRSVPVFDRDAYTARFPTLNYKKVTAKKADDFYERMNVSRDLGDDGSSFMSQLWDAVKNDRVQSPDKLSRLFQTYTAPRMLYAKEVLGKEFKVPMRPIERKTFFGHEKSWRDFVKKNAELKRTDEDAYNKAAAKAIKVAADEYLEREGRDELRSIYMEEIDRYSGNGVNWNYLDRAIKDATDFGKKRVDAPKLVESVDKVVKQNDPAYLKWISEQVSGLFQEPTITLRGREVSASLDNIVEAMTIGATSGAEKTMTFGVGKTSALLGKRFKSIEEIKQSRDQVVSNNLKNQIKSENEKLLEDYRMKAVEFYTGKDWRGKIDTFAGFDDAMEALTKAGKMALTDGNIRLALQSKKFRGVSNEVIELARQSIDAIRSASTEYFEAKPQRAVKLREFKGAVVPKGTDPEVIAALENSGLTIVQYNSKSEGDRAAKVEKLAKSLNRVNKNVLFSNSSNATQSSAITEAEATTAITSNLGNAAKVLIDAGQIVLVRTEEGLRNLAGAKYMTAWHGSPHDHDKFDSSKIGTGEGAQAYGYGLYFAGARSVAEWYKNALAKPQIALDGEPLKFQSDDFANALRNILRQVKKGTSFYDAIDDEASILESSKMPSRMSDAQRLRGLKEGSVGEVNAGKLYKVELAPSEDQYLDWDKPLSEQSEFVREALKSVGLPKKYHSEDKTGRDIYHLLSGESASHITGRDDGQFGDKAASDYLHSIGIRGIRYLDGNSRGNGAYQVTLSIKGKEYSSTKFQTKDQAEEYASEKRDEGFSAVVDIEGDRNYVIFSDDDVSITAKYAKQQGAIQGATLPDGRIVLVLENITKDNIGGVLEHEGFHSSIRQLLGEKTYQQLMTRLDQLSKLNKSWAAQAEKSIPADTKPENWLEEIGAYAIEIYNRGEQLPGSIRKWVEDFLSAIRSAIISSKHMPERAKLMAMKALKPQDLSRLAIAGLKAKANGIGQAQVAGRMAYSKINQTSTAAFKKWFGDSKVVDADGNPLVMYHGTNSEFGEFSYKSPQKTVGAKTHWMGFFFAKNADFANRFTRGGTNGANIMPIYLSIKNPYRATAADIERYNSNSEEQNDLESVALEEKGFDGIFIEVDGKHDEIIAFDPTQIKSAIGNNGNFDGSNPDIRYSRAAVNQPSAFNLPEWTRRDTVQQRVQDRYNRIRDVIKAVRNQGGNVNDLNDFSMGEDRFHGVAMERVNNIQDRLQSLLDEAKAKDITMEEVTMFAYAEHAPSRNAAMQQKNPNVTTGSGMSDQEAADIIAAADKEGKKADLEALTAKMREIAKDTMARQVSSGLTPQSEADVYQAKYGDKWVPLRGFETIDAEGNTFRGTGKGFNIRGKENLRALGRDSEAGQILENILLDAERTAIRSTKNTEVNHRFLRFVMDNPDKNLWEVDAVKTNRSLRGDKVKEDLVIDKSDNTIGMKVQGEMVYVKIHDNHLFEQLANQWNDIEMNGIPYLQDFSRYLAKSYTAWSPEFALYTNPARDIQAALFSITGREGIGMAGKFAKAYPKALKMAYNSEVKGNDDPLYAEYKAQGGKTGFWNHNNLETKVKEIETLIKDMEATAGKNPFRYSLKMLKALEAIVSNHAGALENATRFASYIAMRDAGKSREEAASFAKNLNVNFNRRGTWTAGIGSVVLFFNPAIQGIHNQYETLVHGKHKKQAWALMGAHIGAMAALALLNAAGGEDDDGVKWWDKIPDYEKERNMILVLPPYMKDLGIPIKDSTGRYLKIPMPYQWNIGAYAGTLMADTYRNSENPAEGTSLGKASMLLAKATATAYMPVSGAPPSVAPMLQHWGNKKPFGEGPLYPENQWNAHKPNSEKYSAKQKDTAWQEWASFVNSATGGDKFKKGIVSVPPAVWKNYVKTYLGGPMSFVEGIYDASAEDDITKAPFIRKAYGEVGLNADAGKFYQTTEKPIEAAKAYKDAAKSDPKYAKEMMQSEKVMIQLGELAMNYKEQLGKFTKDDIRIKDNVDYTDAEKRLKLKINEKRRSDYQEEYLAKQRQKLGDASVK